MRGSAELRLDRFETRPCALCAQRDLRVQRRQPEREPHQALDLAVGPEPQEESNNEQENQDHAYQRGNLARRVRVAHQAFGLVCVVVAGAVGDVAESAVRTSEPPATCDWRVLVSLGARQANRGKGVAHGLHGPLSPRPPMQPVPSLEPSGQRRRSTLEALLRYQPTLMMSVLVVVPAKGHEDPAVQGLQETMSSSGSLS